MKLETERLYKVRAGEKTGRERESGELFFLSESGTGEIVAALRMVAGTKDFLIVGGKRWPTVDKIEAFDVHESTGEVVAIAVEGKQRRALFGGEKQPAYSGIGDWAVSNEHALAYVAVENKKVFVVRAATKSAPFELASNVAFSPDGEHLAWVINEGGKRGKFGSCAGGKWYAVVDGQKRSEGFEQITTIGWSPDGRLAFIANSGGESDGIYDATGGDWYAVIDGVRGPRFDHINRVIGLQWSDDSRPAYLASVKKKEVAVFDGEASDPYESVMGVRWIGGRRPFYELTDSFVIDGVRTPRLGKVGPHAFSPDYERFAYVVDVKRKRHVVVDGELGPAFSQDLQTSPVFSPDGAHVAYVLNDKGKCYVQVDDERFGGDLDNVFGVRLGASNRVAYTGFKDGEGVWVVDGRVEQAGDGGGDFAFSGDGEHYAYAFTKGKKSALVIDGAPAFEGLDAVFGLIWAARSKCFVALAARGDERLLLRAR